MYEPYINTCGAQEVATMIYFGFSLLEAGLAIADVILHFLVRISFVSHVHRHSNGFQGLNLASSGLAPARKSY